MAAASRPSRRPATCCACVNGLSGDIYAVRPGGHGDVTDTHMAWHTPRKGKRDIPSPIVIGNYITVVDMKGIATCYDAAQRTRAVEIADWREFFLVADCRRWAGLFSE